MRWDNPELIPREDKTGSQAAPRRGDASDVQIVLPGRGLQYPGQVVALNARGCRVQTKCRLEDGTVVEVWLRTEGMPLRLAASLIEKNDQGVLFEFQPMPLRKQDQVETLRNELGLA